MVSKKGPNTFQISKGDLYIRGDFRLALAQRVGEVTTEEFNSQEVNASWMPALRKDDFI